VGSLALMGWQSDELMLIGRGWPLKKQESRWAFRRSGSSHLKVGPDWPAQAYLKPAKTIYTL
jgi:hypothetical protein